ncbi:MAG: MFS transporter [Candidatus Woesearchaeota archaeon]
MKHALPLRKMTQSVSSIYVLGIVIFFWTLFDSMITYITPLILESRGLSNTWIGIIIASSSIGGAIFDFLICRFIKNINYRRTLMFMLALCFTYPLILGTANSVVVFILAMLVWGLYYDFYGFSIFDYISRYTKKENYSSSFGVIQVFRSIGSIVAPLLVSIILVGILFRKVFLLAYIFLIISLIFYFVLIYTTKKVNYENLSHEKKRNIFVELHLWKKIGRKIISPLTVTFFLFFIEAFFWTLSPLYAENFSMTLFGGIFLAAYSVPMLTAGWIVKKFTEKYGKKRTAITSLLIGSVIMCTFLLITNPYWAIIVVLCSAFFFGLAYPSISGAYADYISEQAVVEKEIETLEDASFNVAYILGPLSAGLLSDIFSIPLAFAILGGTGVIVAIILLLTTPKSIVIKISSEDLK